MNKFFSLIAISLLISISFLFSSCSNQKNNGTSNSNASTKIKETNAPVDKVVTPVTTESFGSKSALTDKNLTLQKMLIFVTTFIFMFVNMGGGVDGKTTIANFLILLLFLSLLLISFVYSSFEIF